MTTRALLWINRSGLLFEKAAGLSALERQLFTLARAGLSQVWINVKKPSEETLASIRLPPGLEILWSDRSKTVAADCLPPYLGVSGDHFIRTETLGYLAQAPFKTRAAFHDDQDASVVQIVPCRQEDSAPYRKQPLPEGASLFLEPPLTQGPVTDWLLSLGPKSADGFMARNFDRFISLSITRRLLGTAATPNQMTILSCLLGLLGAALFLPATRAWGMAGALFIWLHSVLDGCDGELARIRFQESALGANLDFWGDNLVHISLFGCLSAGFYRATGNPLNLILGVSAAAGILGSACLAFRRKIPKDSIAALLAQRDFIYLLAAMAYLDLLYYFLWAGAVGAPLFLIIMISVRRPHEQVKALA